MLAYELAHNPDRQSQQAQDSKSNPFAVLRLPGRTLLADGGANVWRPSSACRRPSGQVVRVSPWAFK